MKIKLPLLIILLTQLLISCNNDATKDNNTSSISIASSTAIEEVPHRGGQAIDMGLYESVNVLQIGDLEVDMTKIETIIAESAQSDIAASNDAAVVNDLFNNLMLAEKETQLDILFSMSEAPIENDMFLFSIESTEAKDLTFQVYDEEGFSVAAHNQLTVNEGQNYKALNVASLKEGSYLFRIKDKKGRELVRSFDVSK